MTFFLFLRRMRFVIIACGVGIVFLVVGYFLLIPPPATFPSESIVTIAKGTSAEGAAQELAAVRIVRSKLLLETLLRVSGAAGEIQAGTYRFHSPQNVFTIAFRLVAGAYELPPVRITFIEGATVRDMSEQVADAFSSISAEDFLEAGKSYEGYVFPDTYFFSPSDDTATLLKMMRDNFDTKMLSRSRDLSSSGHTLADVVVMASLIEKEARTPTVRRIVAGILWNRLALQMPLQVDAVFGYINNRDTYSPSFADLKIDSPYNTYLYKGLPPGPICNPGLDAIDAALHPTETNYLYYLTDKNGVMHYAKTYAEHQSNQRKYLN